MSAAHELFVDDREEALVDGDVDPAAESAWAAEIEGRARRAIAGESEGLDCDAVLSRIERRLRGVSKPLRFDVEAAQELDVAAAYYEQEREGLGLRFMTEAREALARVRQLPASGALFPGVSRDLCVRRMHLHRFPYAIVFVDLPIEIRVVAVAHAHRRPGYWKDRVARHEAKPPPRRRDT